MSRHSMSKSEEQQVQQAWIHRGQIAVALYLSIVCIAGVLFLGAMLARGEYIALVIGALVATASCLSGAVAWGALSLAQSVATQGEQLAAERERIALLEAEIQFRDEPIHAVPQWRTCDPSNRSRPAEAFPATSEESPDVEPIDDVAQGIADPTRADQMELAETLNKISDALVESTEDASDVPTTDSAAESSGTDESSEEPEASRVDSELTPADESEVSPPETVEERSVEAQFLDAVAEDDLATARQTLRALNGAVTPSRRTELEAQYAHLKSRVAARLRAEFSALLRAENYHEAINKGNEIAALLPESRMCSDFEVIRPHLESRAGEL